MSHIEQTYQSVQTGTETSKHEAENGWCSSRLHTLGKKEQECCKSTVLILHSLLQLHEAMSHCAHAMKSSYHLSSCPDLKRGQAPAALAASGSMSTT